MTTLAASVAPSGAVMDISVPAMFEVQRLLTPDRIAVESGDRRLSYAELDARSAALARELLARGIGRGDMVGISMLRNELMLVAALGVMRAGAAYVPLDPDFPPDRLVYMAEHSRLATIVTGHRDEVRPELAAGRGIVALAEPGLGAQDLELPVLAGDDPAYVLYTSGSTGKPKGVLVLHRNLSNFVLGMREEPGISGDDVLLSVTTLSFDIAALELYLPLSVGARVVIASAIEHRDPEALMRMVRERDITFLQTTPAVVRLLFDADQGQALKRIRLLVGGEELPRDLAEFLPGRVREAWNMYGPTETTVWSTLHRLQPGQGGAVPIGHPIRHTVVHVLDEQRQPLPEGEIGELWIGGDGVAAGYLHAPELTAERFLPDPFVGGTARMYRTGDLGSRRAGVLHFHGRCDHQIKVRGFRIEPGEIEAVALADPGVFEAVAVARDFAPGDRRLVLYVVARGEDPGLPERLRGQLRAQLLHYMVPQHVEWLAALPKTPNGKIDRNALPRPAAAASVAAVQAAAPVRAMSANEKLLAGIWRELIGVEDIAANDNFFDLGGHSMLAVEMVARVQRATGVRLSLLDTATSTLAALALDLPAAAPAGAARPGLLARLRRVFGAG